MKKKQKKSNSITAARKVYLLFLLILAVSAVTVLLVWVCYNVLPPKIITDITADGMIGFIGNIIGSSVAVFIAFFTAKYEKENIILENELELDKHRNEILPLFNIELKEFNESTYSILIQNNSTRKAIDLYLFEYPLVPLIKSETQIKRKISTCDFNNSNFLFIDDFYLNKAEGKFCLSEINLIYYDEEGNLVSQIYKSYKKNNRYGYSLIQTGYESYSNKI